MINHVRTLLLNESGPKPEDVSVAGDTYIPAHAPIEHTAGLSVLRGLLYGARSDYEGRLYRTNQYLAIIHATEYAPYVYHLDPRITYSPDKLLIFEEGNYRTSVSPATLTVSGTWAGVSHRVQTRWKVTAKGSNFEVVNITDNLQETVPASGARPLPGSTLAFGVNEQPAVDGTVWLITHRCHPGPDLGAILASCLQTDLSVSEAVFGPVPVQEPFKTFYNLFKVHYAWPYRLAGLVLGYAYRLESIRVGSVVTV